MSDFDISYNLNYGSMARGKQQVDPWVQPSLLGILTRIAPPESFGVIQPFSS